jgi:D-alanyl-D-alanine carboxypeptidase
LSFALGQLQSAKVDEHTGGTAAFGHSQTRQSHIERLVYEVSSVGRNRRHMMHLHSSTLESRLRAELAASLAADASLPGLIATVRAPRRGIDFSVALTGARSQDPLTPGHAFRIASVTKVYVAAAVMRLVEQERLDLNAAITALCSGDTINTLRNGGYAPENISLFQLLTHTSGLTDHGGSSAYRDAVTSAPEREWRRKDQIAFAMELGGPLAAPGARFSYSDTGYIIIGECLERVCADHLGAIVRENLNFERLGLTQTHWERLESAPIGQCRAPQFLGQLSVQAINPSTDLWGGGGLVATTSEIASFFRALLRGEIFSRPETLAAALLTPSAPFSDGDALHCSLLRGMKLGGEHCWWHGGYWGVVGAYFPARDISLALAFNQVDCGPETRGGPDVFGLADRLAYLVLQADVHWG